LDEPHILALTAETVFWQFKEQVPLKFKKEISAVQCKRKTFLLISLSTPVSFHWTVPFSKKTIFSPLLKIPATAYHFRSQKNSTSFLSKGEQKTEGLISL
jgi:hypothetical protein